MGTHVVVLGTLVEGIHEIYGPFAHFDEALEWAESNLDENWWIMPLSEAE